MELSRFILLFCFFFGFFRKAYAHPKLVCSRYFFTAKSYPRTQVHVKLSPEQQEADPQCLLMDAALDGVATEGMKAVHLIQLGDNLGFLSSDSESCGYGSEGSPSLQDQLLDSLVVAINSSPIEPEEVASVADALITLTQEPASVSDEVVACVIIDVVITNTTMFI
jgi:hypothetical protein